MKRGAGISSGGALLVIVVAASASGARLPSPATSSYARGSRADDDASCAKCHSKIAEEHSGSLHHASFSDPSFQRGYKQEPTAFCRSCHVPESKPEDAPDAFARESGVACVTCHRPDPNGAIVTGQLEDRGLAAIGRGAQPKAPHAVVRVADFGTRACAACHEFAFPGGEKNGAKGLMQKTMSEHAESAQKDRSCASCHMRKDERGSGHRFVASRDRALLTNALAVKVEREENRVRFTLASKDVGHAFPTGDLFRRLVVRLKPGPSNESSSSGGRVIEQPLMRNFGAERGVRFEASDLRLRTTKEFTLPLPAGIDATWEVLYQRVTAVDQAPPFTATVEDEVVLARGALREARGALR